jgi:hypothetical protein
MDKRMNAVFALVIMCCCWFPEPTSAGGDPDTLLWGDTHVHTSYSVDAFFLGNRSIGPDDAYRFARGLPVIHPSTGVRVRIDRPLDFLVVADHAEQLGVGLRLSQGDPLVADTDTGREFIRLLKAGRGREVFQRIVRGGTSGKPLTEMHSDSLRRASWTDITAAADAHNAPGQFTSFIGWEWSSTIDAANLHRVILTPQGAETANQYLPFSSFEGSRPEQLWAWLERTSAQTGADFVAIPHNSNLSKGQMFPAFELADRAEARRRARLRARWETVAEITQTKGDSETHPVLSPTDEFADFEFFPSLIDTRPGTDKTPSTTDGDYLRSALKRGLSISNTVGVNPYKLGFIGSSDIHSGLSTTREDAFPGVGGNDSMPAKKRSAILSGATGWSMSAAGLAAVWAGENTRQAIFDAFRRREVYATTGSRIRLRFFGGWDFKAGDESLTDAARMGYAKGVPMGQTLPVSGPGQVPSFLLQAGRDPEGANLDRIQIVKGWVDSRGATQERVYDVVWSGDRAPDASGRLPAVGNSVNPATGSYTNSIGSAQLSTVWRDAEFDPDRPAFYYARVLEIPTPRHSLLDAIALGVAPEQTGTAPTIQERAYSSPIWYTPTDP